MPHTQPGDLAGRRLASQVVVALKGSAEFGEWLAQLAQHQRTPTAELVDRAVVFYAQHVGFDKPAPPRYPKR